MGGKTMHDRATARLMGHYYCPYERTIRFSAHEQFHAVQPAASITDRHSLAIYTMCDSSVLRSEDKQILQSMGYRLEPLATVPSDAAEGDNVEINAMLPNMIKAGRQEVNAYDILPLLPASPAQVPLTSASILAVANSVNALECPP
eukprot:2875773-Amphidinium_carterae.1